MQEKRLAMDLVEYPTRGTGSGKISRGCLRADVPRSARGVSSPTRLCMTYNVPVVSSIQRRCFGIIQMLKNVVRDQGDGTGVLQRRHACADLGLIASASLRRRCVSVPWSSCNPLNSPLTQFFRATRTYSRGILDERSADF